MSRAAECPCGYCRGDTPLLFPVLGHKLLGRLGGVESREEGHDLGRLGGGARGGEQVSEVGHAAVDRTHEAQAVATTEGAKQAAAADDQQPSTWFNLAMA